MANDTTTIQIIIDGENRASPAFKEATKQADGFGKSIAKSIGVFAAAQVAGNLLSGALERISQGLKSLTGGALQMAGQFQEMEFVSLAVGRAMGITENAIRSSNTALREAGIRSDVAAKTTATLARNQIDLARASELANIAQATGVFIKQDSSATMERLTQAVTVGNTRILRTMGIMVDFNKIVGEGAAAMGKSVDALTQRELAELRVQGVIDNSAAIMDVYGAAMESPTKALRSLTGRVIPEFQAALGQSFLPAWKTVISTISGAVKWFTSAVQEGGQLFPLMTSLGATASLVADGFKSLVNNLLPVKDIFEETAAATGGMDLALGELGKTATTAGNAFTSGLINKLADAADKALRGGIEISAGLAEGLIRGAAGALTSAMTFIGGLLSSWLQPGSPPKVARNIVKWGAGTFTEYLKGFGEADFSTLESLQSPIKDVLSALVGTGALGAKAAGETFKKLTFDISEALAAFKETGKIDTSIFTELVNVGGQYGKQLAGLAKKQFEFAAASIAAEKAQESLANAMESQDKSQDKLNAIMEDFNQALRDGADPSVLNAKREAFLNAKKQAEQAKKEVKLSKTQNKEAQKRVGPLKKQVGLQEKLLKQLIEFSKAQRESGGPSGISGAGVAGVGGGGVAAAIAASMPTPGDFDIGSPIADAISNAKDLLSERFGDLFSPITDAWENVQPDLEELKEQWETFSIDVSEAWEKFTLGVSDAVKEHWPSIRDTIVDAWEAIGNIWGTVLKPALQGLWDLVVPIAIVTGILLIALNLETLAIAALIAAGGIGAAASAAWAAITAFAIAALPIVLLGAALILLGFLWKKYGEQIKVTVKKIGAIILFGMMKASKAVTQAWFIIKFKTFEFLNSIVETITLAFLAIKFKIFETLVEIQENWSFIWESLKIIVGEVINRINAKIQLLLDKLQGIKDKFTAIWRNLKDSILPIFKDVSDFISLTLGPIMEWFNNTILSPLKETFEFLSVAASNFAGWLKLILERLGGIPEDPFGDVAPDITRVIRGNFAESREGTANQTIINFEQIIHTTAGAGAVVEGWNEMMALTGAG